MDVTVLENFKAKAQIVKQLKVDVNEKNRRLDSLCAAVDELKDERRRTFKDGFVIISNKVKELYQVICLSHVTVADFHQMLTRGGDAELEYKDPAGPFTEGIEFSVRPPGKSWRIIQNLSGELHRSHKFQDENNWKSVIDTTELRPISGYICSHQ